MRPIERLAVGTLVFCLSGCIKQQPDDDSAMSQSEALEALAEATASFQASALTSSSVDIATTFTIGQAVENAASEIRSFIQTQLPCAEVTLSDAILTVRYGVKSGSCTYKGHTLKGRHTIQVTRNEVAQVVVDHTWTALSDGVVKVTGTAHVTWDLASKVRHVEHDLTWMRSVDGRTGQGTGEVTQKPLATGLSDGIEEDGSLSWAGAGGQWDLAVQGVEARWTDPVPQAGTYRLSSPQGRALELAFLRVDKDTIQVTMKSGAYSLAFDVDNLLQSARQVGGGKT